MQSKFLKVGTHKIEITNPDKLLFPKSKITKEALVNYYYQISSIMLPYLKNRAVSMHRFPNGIAQEGFYHKNAPEFFPDWIKTIELNKKDNQETVNYVVIKNAATLVYLANYGCLTPHVWLSKIDKLDYPDRMIFDLDPPDQKSFKRLCKTAKDLKTILHKFGLHSFVMTTGSKGLHVVVPLKRTKNFTFVRNFAKKIALLMIDQNPENLTTEIRKVKRGKRIFIDILRNSSTATAVPPYSVRAYEGAPIATPLYWHELDDSDISSQKYNIKNIFKHIAKNGDPWKDINKFSKPLK